jgi:hypothetical protein
MKVCTKCKVERTIDNSWKGTTYCKKCYGEWKKQWKDKNKEHVRERRMVSYRKNKGRFCKECGNSFVGKGVKREFCSTLCKLLGSVVKKNGCWEWQDAIGPFGYAETTCYETNKREHAHRVSYRIFKGEIPDGLYVCHHCDNRKCIAPDHLFIGTAKENMQDALKKGRLEHVKLMMPKGEKNGSSKLKEFEVKEIKKLILEGEKIAVIARKFNVSWTAVDSIKKNKTWRHVLLE